MAINFKKSACLRVGQRYDTVPASRPTVSYYGQIMEWKTELRYIGLHIVS